MTYSLFYGNIDSLKGFNMTKLNDLTGKKFGRWTVIGRSGKNKSGNARWLCRCNCGKERNYLTASLNQGATGNTCKCPPCWVNKKFGMLTVIRKDGKKSNHNEFFICKCDCGNEKRIWGSSLFTGGSRSCGCIKEKTSIQRGCTKIIGYYKKKCRERELEFTLSHLDFINLTSKNCYYCDGIPSNLVHKKGKIKDLHYIYNGIDRVDNSKGYTNENSVTCCRKCNLMKRDMSVSEWISHMEKILNNLKQKAIGE